MCTEEQVLDKKKKSLQNGLNISLPVQAQVEKIFWVQ